MQSQLHVQIFSLSVLPFYKAGYIKFRVILLCENKLSLYFTFIDNIKSEYIVDKKQAKQFS